MSLKKFLSEVEKVLKDDKVKTSIYLMHKINFVRSTHLESNKEDQDIVGEFLSSIKVKGLNDLKANISNRLARYREAIKTSESKIAEIASHKIKNGANIFVYETSPKIANALKNAKERGIKFSVHTIDSASPMAEEARKIISDSKIPMKNFSGVLVNKALESSDILFFEPVAVEKSSVIVTPETNAVLEVARKNNVLSYGVSSLFGNAKKPNQNNLEKADPKNINGIITEAGIVKIKNY